MKPNIIGIYMAAGKSSRMGQPKLSIELRKGERLGGIALKVAFQSRLSKIIMVTRSGDNLEWLSGGLSEYESAGRCVRVISDAADRGMSYSLRCGLEAAAVYKADAAIVMLADQPFITLEMIDRLITAYTLNPELHYVASGDKGLKKPPILWSRTMFPVLAELRGDEGARSIYNSPDYDGAVIEEVLAYRFQDADTLGDIAEMKETLSNN
jgi:molybdenum cofactor cytidylyltransferase